jgi:hypothetical protein
MKRSELFEVTRKANRFCVLIEEEKEKVDMYQDTHTDGLDISIDSQQNTTMVYDTEEICGEGYYKKNEDHENYTSSSSGYHYELDDIETKDERDWENPRDDDIELTDEPDLENPRDDDIESTDEPDLENPRDDVVEQKDNPGWKRHRLVDIDANDSWDGGARGLDSDDDDDDDSQGRHRVIDNRRITFMPRNWSGSMDDTIVLNLRDLAKYPESMFFAASHCETDSVDTELPTIVLKRIKHFYEYDCWENPDDPENEAFYIAPGYCNDVYSLCDYLGLPDDYIDDGDHGSDHYDHEDREDDYDDRDCEEYLALREESDRENRDRRCGYDSDQ